MYSESDKNEFYYNNLLLNNNLLSSNIKKIFQQTPQVHILKEEIDQGYYLREQTWDILTDHFCFSPIAFSMMRINLSNANEINPTNLLPIEEATGRQDTQWQLITENLINKEMDEELNLYLNPPFLGRFSKLIIEDNLVAELIEFVSRHPNEKVRTSLLEYISPHSFVDTNTNRRLEDVLFHIKEALETDIHEVIEILLSKISQEARGQIEDCIEGIEHFAFIVSPDIKLETLDALTTQTGFPLNHQVLPSKVLAKELGALTFKDEVPTQIYKAWGFNRKHQDVGVEIFIPQTNPQLIDQWIHDGRGAHVALRVKDEKSMGVILKLVDAFHIEIPKFMHGQPMRNEKENATILYIDVDIEDYRFRLEFYYKPTVK